MVAENRWEVQQIDVMTAFLNKEIKDDVFVEMPIGWRQ
jgi:hypothetical protein